MFRWTLKNKTSWVLEEKPQAKAAKCAKSEENVYSNDLFKYSGDPFMQRFGSVVISHFFFNTTFKTWWFGSPKMVMAC